MFYRGTEGPDRPGSGVQYPHRRDAKQRSSPSPRHNGPLLLLAVASVLAAGVALAMLFASVPPGDDSAEAGFARDMIVHHGQAVQMAEIVRDRTESGAVRLLASDISLTQQGQIGIMQGGLGCGACP